MQVSIVLGFLLLQIFPGKNFGRVTNIFTNTSRLRLLSNYFKAGKIVLDKSMVQWCEKWFLWFPQVFHLGFASKNSVFAHLPTLLFFNQVK